MFRSLMFCPLLALAAMAAPAGICVENRTDGDLLFTLELHETGQRRTVWLGTNGLACLEGPGPGVVGVFEDEFAIEGCSRLTADGQTRVLLGFARFDRCYWQEHDG